MRGLIEFPEDTPGVHTTLMRIAEQDLSAENFTPPPPQRMPGCRHLPQAVTAGVVVSMDLCHAIATIEDELHWTQSAHYTDELMRQPGYKDNYAYTEIIGSNGLFAGDDFRMGLLLLGPGLHYIDHQHSAPELYWLLTGPIDYSRSRGKFEPVGTASTIWNEANEIHAMKIGDQPLLAVWAWTRDVNELPVLVPA